MDLLATSAARFSAIIRASLDAVNMHSHLTQSSRALQHDIRREGTRMLHARCDMASLMTASRLIRWQRQLQPRMFQKPNIGGQAGDAAHLCRPFKPCRNQPQVSHHHDVTFRKCVDQTPYCRTRAFLRKQVWWRLRGLGICQPERTEAVFSTHVFFHRTAWRSQAVIRWTYSYLAGRCSPARDQFPDK